MRDWRVAAVVAVSLVVLAVWTGLGLAVIAPGIILVLITWLNARDWTVYGRHPWDLPSTAPVVSEVAAPSIDLDDELEDLLRSTLQLASRRIEDTGRLDPFVTFEDGDGEFRVRKVQVDNPEHTLARARTVARQVDPSAPRVILVVPGQVEVGGRVRRAILLEASEYRFRERTMAFAIIYRPKRMFLPASTEGHPMYVGETLPSLRFAPRAATSLRSHGDL